MGKAVDQGGLFLGSLIVARSVGPTAFAPFGVLLVLNSLSVQLSDLGLGFAIHGSPLSTALPGRSLRRVRAVGGAALSMGLAISALTHSVLPLVVGLVWALSAEGYIRKAATVRAGIPFRVLQAEATGTGLFVVAAASAALLHGPWLFALGLGAKHLAEVLVLRRCWSVDGTGAISSYREWFGQLLTFTASNVDYLIVGLVLSPSAFSIYVMAFRLVSALPALVANALTQDTFVELAEGTPDRSWVRLHRETPRRVAPLSLLGVLLGVGAAGVARTVLGASWGELVVVVAVLSAALPFRLVLGPMVAIAISRGRPGLVIRTETVRCGLTATCVWLGSTRGLAGAAGGSVVATAVGVGLLLVLLAPSRLGQASRS